MRAKLALKIGLKITPQQILTSQLLQASAGDLEELIRQELAENPALEPRERRSAPPSTASASSSVSSDFSQQLIAQPTAIEQLSTQIACAVQEPELALAIFLLDSLDEHGYLRTPIVELAEAAGVAEAALLRALALIHELEPPGIGARDLRECLRLQYRHLAATGVEDPLVGRILDEAWDEFSAQQWTQVARKLKVSRAAVADVQRFIRTNFYPYPLALISQAATPPARLAQADLIVQCEKSAVQHIYKVVVPNAAAERLCISPAFVQKLGDTPPSPITPAEQRWLADHRERARHFLQALHQRRRLLRRIGDYLVDYQTAFLAHGPCHLKPLTQNQVAAVLGVHESTVSRAIHDKHALLPDGHLLPLAAFFDHTLPAKAVIHRLLAGSDRSISDRAIADMLRGEGIQLARRTVTKYREQMRHGRKP
jgi:RNA polymerase sigma-54 factor